MSVSLWCDEEGRASQKAPLRAQWDPSVSGVRVINRLLQSEERYLLSPLYISLIQNEPHRRDELAKWVLEVCCECGCEESVYPLSVTLLDRFLSASLSLPISPLCLSAACILIASKVTGSEPASADNLCAAANFCFLPKNLRDMERVVLATLRWDVAVVTPHDFLPHFLSSLERVEEDGQTDRDAKASLSTLRRHIDTLVAMCVCDSRFLGIPPSLIAAAALNAALSGLGSKCPQMDSNELATLCQIDLGVLQYYTELIEGALTEHLRSGPREGKMCPEVEKKDEALEEIDTERANLHALNNNHRLTTAAATAASNAGILSRRRYIHRGSGHNRHRTLHYPIGTNIPSLWTNSRPHVNTTHRTSNLSNLRSPPPAPLSISFALLNTRSLTNKSPVISELILDNNIDFLLLTETWQQPSDYYALNQATPTNYSYIAKPRSSGRGGGIAVLHKQSLSVTELDLNLPPMLTFEYLALSLPNSITVILLYRPPKTHPSFLSELSQLLTIASSLSNRLLLTGDFNIHVDLPNSPLTPDFLSLLDCFHLTQHINFPTHAKGHTLDLVCSSSLPLSNLRPLPFPLSDHHCILFSAPLPSPHHSTKRSISFRNIKFVNPLILSQLISSALPPDSAPPSSPDDYAILLDSILSDSLNSMAPWKTITVSFTTSSPWYTSELRTMKQTGRQLERLYKKTHLTVHAEAYKQHISSYRDALLAAKSAHYSTLINSTNRNPRILFSTVKTLLQPPDNNPPSSTDLCNSFLHSFNNKISQINTSLTASITNSFTPPSPDFHPP
ncbi:hypothetical protein SKAU_G00131040 [Synaphobranchus kaupii]|uniref:Uncharacterized protein n=1 Tax=Synaphobranchus kaupii TaxID=118154 RepID=A0A9Q1FQK6_SYNKA|nr:hypothetical protein SKAU_G00131040 [Synaphobranchus kaupii]